MFQAVLPCVLATSVWAAVVSLVDQRWPRALGWLISHSRPITTLPIELQGTAIGLLIVFRTNNGYERLAEARTVLGRVLCLCREIAQSVACTWPLTPLYEEPPYEGRMHPAGGRSISGAIGGDVALMADHPGAIGGLPAEPALHVARYLVAFAWSTKAILREPIRAESLQSPEDVLRILLPPEEVTALLRAPSIPIAILGRLRLLLATTQVPRGVPCMRACMRRMHVSAWADARATPCTCRCSVRASCNRTCT